MANKTNWRGTLEERLKRNTIVDTATECHNWLAYKDKDGYGSIKNGTKFQRVHRVIWELKNGKIPDRLVICHKCDNPSCLNIKHLFIGTPKENNDDKVTKNRQAKGSRNGQAKLNERDVTAIRKMYKKGFVTLKQVAEKFGVTYAMVHLIVTNKNWNHV